MHHNELHQRTSRPSTVLCTVELARPDVLRACCLMRCRHVQDLKVHHNELLSKFVGIMRERLTASLRQLPGLAGQWQYSKPGTQPSAFASTLTKQLRILLQVCRFLRQLMSGSCECAQPYQVALKLIGTVIHEVQARGDCKNVVCPQALSPRHV